MWLPPQPLRLVCDGDLGHYLLVCEPDPYISHKTGIWYKSRITVKLDVNTPVCRGQRTDVELQMMFHFSTSFDKLDLSNLSSTVAISRSELHKVLSVEKVGTEIGVCSAGECTEWDWGISTIAASSNNSASDVEIITRLDLKIPLNSAKFNRVADSLVVPSSNTDGVESFLIRSGC